LLSDHFFLSFDHISCLTAVTMEGKALWQIGRPDPYNDVLANDTPFQIHDLDGDGKNEVVMVKDFKIQIVEGRTGKVKSWVWMPEAPKDNKDRPYEMEVGDSIALLVSWLFERGAKKSPNFKYTFGYQSLHCFPPSSPHPSWWQARS
jgi:hypothetical protein